MNGYRSLAHDSELLLSGLVNLLIGQKQEFKATDLRTTEDYTRRSRAFLDHCRQFQSVATDYDILVATLEHLKNEHDWLAKQHRSLIQQDTSQDMSSAVIGGIETRELLKGFFDWYLKEVQLIRTYSSLYVERTKIGVNECFAMVNQRDAEVYIPVPPLVVHC